MHRCRRRCFVLTCLLIASTLPQSNAFALGHGLRGLKPRVHLGPRQKGDERAEKRRRNRKKRKFKLNVSLPWLRPKREPKQPLVVLRETMLSAYYRSCDKLRKWADDALAWWHMDQELDARWPMRALFLVSNVAYLISGFGLLERAVTRGSPPVLAYLMMAACGYSSTYHAMQCWFGMGSDQARSTGRVDVGLAFMSGVYFFLECGCDTLLMQSLALLSIGFFVDAFQMGYTVSHSLWHLSGATLAFVGGTEWTRERRKVPWLPGDYALVKRPPRRR